jgi:peptidyl-dipeptidase A
VGKLWHSGYDMTPSDLVHEVHRLWAEVRPLSDELHRYTHRGGEAQGDALARCVEAVERAMTLLGARGADANAILEYFAPLRAYLQRANAGKVCAAPGATSLSGQKQSN